MKAPTTMAINIDRYLPLNTCEQIDTLLGSSLRNLILYDASIELEVMMAIKKVKMQLYFKNKLEEGRNTTKQSESKKKKGEEGIKGKAEKKEVTKKKRMSKREADKLIVQGLAASLVKENFPLERYKKEYKKALKVAEHYNLKNFFNIELRYRRALYGHDSSVQEKPVEKKKQKSNVDSFSKAFALEWKNVYFKNGQYIFSPQNHINKELKSLVVKAPMCLECYNYIRSYFEHKLPNITWRYNTKTNEIQIVDKIKFKNAILMIAQEYKQAKIEKRKIVEERDNGGSKISFATAMSKAAMMTASSFRIYKSKFIDHLVYKQLEEYKIVPLNESFDYRDVCGYTESAFLFSLGISNKYVMIVLENVNPNRSTILFYTKKVMYMEALKAIHSFMQGGSYNKRSELRAKGLSFEKYGIVDYSSINHEDLADWMVQLRRRSNWYRYD